MRLFSQFVAAAAVTILVSIGLLAYFVSEIAKNALLRNAADEGSALIRIFIAPIAQELAHGCSFAPESIRRLDDLAANELRARILLVKVWCRDRTIAYSTNPDLIGTKLPTTRLPRALTGEVIATFDDLYDAKVDFGYEPNLPLIEVYSPIIRTGTDRIIAVGEVYLDGAPIADEARAIKLTTVVIVATVTLPMAFVLFLFVYRANATALSHRYALLRMIDEARTLAQQNDRLRRLAEDARLGVARSNEELLARLGQDLHDGPLQLLSLVMLKISVLAEAGDAGRQSLQRKLQDIMDLVAQVLAEMRSWSAGLVLPELKDVSLGETLRLAIRRHEDATGSTVVFRAGDLPPDAPLPIRICLYRVVQEGLNNAFHHAGGRGQEVHACADTCFIHLTVLDDGAEQDADAPRPKSGGGLGLRGLQHRVEAFRGTFEAEPRPGGGTVLRVKLPRAYDRPEARTATVEEHLSDP